MKTGERYYFGAVTFSGASRYPDTFFRRYLAFREGDVFSSAKLTRTRSNLYGADRFKEVFVQADKVKAEDHTIPVSFELSPSPERRIKTGAGYGTDTGPRFLVQYQDLNVVEKGHEFRADLTISQVLNGIGAAYVVPSGESFRDSTALRASLLRETPITYQSNIAMIELDRERGFGDSTQGVAFVRLLEEKFTIGGQTDTSFLVMPGVRLYSQYYDNPIRPQRGYRYGIELRGTDKFLGSSTGIVQALPAADVLIPLPERLTVLLRSQGGFSLQRQSFDQVPVSLRFFAGGDRSVRGYSYQALGPRDATGNVVGGKNLLFGSIEVERAIGENWGVAGFYDAGNAFDSFTGLSLVQSAGLGLHYYSRVGPFRLDIAQQLNGPSLARRIHFTMGIFL
jgi:translocation and assembly module TamA